MIEIKNEILKGLYFFLLLIDLKFFFSGICEEKKLRFLQWRTQDNVDLLVDCPEEFFADNSEDVIIWKKPHQLCKPTIFTWCLLEFIQLVHCRYTLCCLVVNLKHSELWLLYAEIAADLVSSYSLQDQLKIHLLLVSCACLDCIRFSFWRG